MVVLQVEVDLLVEWEWAVVALLLKEAVLSREVWVDLEVEETLLAEEVAETEEHSEVVDVVALSPEAGVVLNLEEGEVLNLVVVAVVLKDEAAGEAVLRVGDEEVDLKEEDVEVALKAGVEVALKAEAGEVLTGVVVADLQDQKDFLAHPNAWVDLLLVMTLHQSEEDLKDRKAAMAMGLLQGVRQQTSHTMHLIIRVDLEVVTQHHHMDHLTLHQLLLAVMGVEVMEITVPLQLVTMRTILQDMHLLLQKIGQAMVHLSSTLRRTLILATINQLKTITPQVVMEILPLVTILLLLQLMMIEDIQIRDLMTLRVMVPTTPTTNQLMVELTGCQF